MRSFNLLLALACLITTALALAKLRIMPLGDSITEWSCWRTLLWDKLDDAGVADRIQFVGSMSDNLLNCVGKSDWDHHHEGHSGYLAIQVASSHLVTWLSAAKPDVVMMMLGTNDVRFGFTTSEILAAYSTMVGQMRQSKDDIKIIVDQILPIGPTNVPINGIDEAPEAQALAAAIPGWARSMSTAVSPIYVVDCNSDYPYADLTDGLHPNAAGDQLIASRIYPTLIQVINHSLAVISIPPSPKNVVSSLLVSVLSVLGL